MVITAPPPVSTSEHDGRALFEEARRRRRRRRVWLVASLVVVSTGLVAFISSIGSGGTHPAKTTSGTHGSSPSSVRGHPSRSSGIHLSEPWALTTAANGDLLVDNEGTNQILERQANGSFTVFAGKGGPPDTARLNVTGGIAVTTNGTIYSARGDQIQAVSPTGELTTIAGVDQPMGLQAGPKNTLYVEDQAGIQSISPSGAVVTILSTASILDGFNSLPVLANVPYIPGGFVVSPSGAIYVADFSPNILVRFSGGTVSPVGATPQYPMGYPVIVNAMAIAPDGSVIVAANDGGLERVIGTDISPLDASMTELNGGYRLVGVAVAPDGEIYTDTDNLESSLVSGTEKQVLIGIDPNGRVHILATATKRSSPVS
jgi:hypothetical protein